MAGLLAAIHRIHEDIGTDLRLCNEEGAEMSKKKEKTYWCAFEKDGTVYTCPFAKTPLFYATREAGKRDVFGLTIKRVKVVVAKP